MGRPGRRVRSPDVQGLMADAFSSRLSDQVRLRPLLGGQRLEPCLSSSRGTRVEHHRRRKPTCGSRYGSGLFHRNRRSQDQSGREGTLCDGAVFRCPGEPRGRQDRRSCRRERRDQQGSVRREQEGQERAARNRDLVEDPWSLFAVAGSSRRPTHSGHLSTLRQWQCQSFVSHGRPSQRSARRRVHHRRRQQDRRPQHQLRRQ